MLTSIMTGTLQNYLENFKRLILTDHRKFKQIKEVVGNTPAISFFLNTRDFLF